MVSKKLVMQREKAKFANKMKKHKSMGPRTSPQETIEDESGRLIDYVDLKFNKNTIPLTDDEIRGHVIVSMRRDPSFNFIRDVPEESYRNLVAEVKQSPSYNSVLKELTEEIKIKDTGKVRKGIRVRKTKRYYFVIVKTKKARNYKRYYDTKTGKSVKRQKLERFLSFKTTTQLKRIDRLEKFRKKDTTLGKIREEERKKERIKRLRGKS